MIPRILETQSGKIKYYLYDDHVSIFEYSGKDLLVTVPDTIEDIPVTCIMKKAFLSQNFVKEIVLPNSIDKIDEYAFARCRKLEKISIPYKDITLGHDILKDCDKLSYIHNSLGTPLEMGDVAYLLAKTLNGLNAFFLFDLKNAGSDEWIRHLDSTIEMRMKKDDMEDFSKMILCGEEEVVCGDDGTIEDSNPDHYKSNRVKEKIRIAFMRLLHRYGINENLEIMLNNYLLDHAKGSNTEETWEVVLNEHGDEKEYYEYLLKIGGINDSNFSDILLDMGDRHTEMKSFLMKYHEDNNDSSSDMFSDFEL